MVNIEKNGCINIDLPIGQDFMYHGKILTVVEHPEEAGCAGCFFIDKPCLFSNIQCTKDLRVDKKNVIFKEVD